ncbi:MAG: hypothetical protein WBX27_17855 [Specibacter sp.]
MGFSHTRHWPAMVLAVLMTAALWAVLSAGPALAVEPGGHESAMQVAAHGPERVIATAPHALGTTTEARSEDTAVAGAVVAAKTTQKTTPEGSPLGVQLATIAVLLALGFGYFKVMGRTGRRTSPRKTE